MRNTFIVEYGIRRKIAGTQILGNGQIDELLGNWGNRLHKYLLFKNSRGRNPRKLETCRDTSVQFIIG